jgi:hypothetical protein
VGLNRKPYWCQYCKVDLNTRYKTRQHAKFDHDWRREFRHFSVKGEIPGYDKSKFIAIAWMIEDHGTNGFHCKPSERLLAKEVELSAPTIGAYRRALVGMGWFKVAGKEGRSEVMDISLPDFGQMSVWMAHNLARHEERDR